MKGEIPKYVRNVNALTIAQYVKNDPYVIGSLF